MPRDALVYLQDVLGASAHTWDDAMRSPADPAAQGSSEIGIAGLTASSASDTGSSTV